MANDRLLASIKLQGGELQGRAKWLQDAIDRHQQCIENAQRAIEVFRSDLQATNLALDGLRANYRELLLQEESEGEG